MILTLRIWYNILNPKLKVIRTTDQAQSILWIDDYIYLALRNEYQSINVDTEEPTPIMTFNTDPIMKILSKDELFLKKDFQGIVYPVEGSNVSRGMQVTNLTWQSSPTCVAIHNPYIISVLNDTLHVYSMESWKQFQTIDSSIKGIKGLTYPDFTFHSSTGMPEDDFLVVYSEKTISALASLPYEYQTESLIRQGHIEDALYIYQETASDDPLFKEKMTAFCEQAAWKKLMSLDFEKAFSYFDKAHFSPAMLLANTFPHLVLAPTKKTYNNMDITTIIKKKKTYLSSEAELNKYIRSSEIELLSYLEYSKTKEPWMDDPQLIKTIHTAMFIIILNSRPTDLVTFLEPLSIDSLEFDLLEEYLKSKKLVYGLGWLYYKVGMFRESLEIWKKIKTSEGGSSFDGIQESLKVLQTSSDFNLIKEYSLNIYKEDEFSFIKIFTSRKMDNLLPEDSVVSFLKSINTDLAIQYLYWLVFETGTNEKKSQHTLINLYLSSIKSYLPTDHTDISKILDENAIIKGYRDSLDLLLKTKSQYDPVVVLNSIETMPLYNEKITLYQRMKEHERALLVILENLGNDEMALQYCKDHNPTAQEDLFLVLLKIYIETEKDKPEPSGTIKFMHEQYAHIDPISALNLLPSSLPLNSIYPFLSKTIRKTRHNLRRCSVSKSLELEENMKSKNEKYKLLKKFVTIFPNDVCSLCKKNIGDKVFARYPNGVVIHYRCYQ